MIDGEKEGMKILPQIPLFFAKALHKYLVEKYFYTITEYAHRFNLPSDYNINEFGMAEIKEKLKNGELCYYLDENNRMQIGETKKALKTNE